MNTINAGTYNISGFAINDSKVTKGSRFYPPVATFRLAFHNEAITDTDRTQYITVAAEVNAENAAIVKQINEVKRAQAVNVNITVDAKNAITLNSMQ